MVFEEPPAPAAREELGFDACVPAARRRICAPGGFAIELARPLPFVRGESESDIVLKDRYVLSAGSESKK